MKIGRNDPCPCGSSFKYKKCCGNDSKPESPINPELRLQDILALVRLGLESLDTFSEIGKPVKVKEVSLMNATTISCVFYCNASNSPDIKGEIASIMGFLKGFFKEDVYPNITLTHYAVIAIDDQDNELMNAICSRSAAELIGQGDSIGWLKACLFQENTPDYRLSIAKRIISEIENALRHVIKDVLCNKYRENWWDTSITDKLGKQIKKMYAEQFEAETNDGDILIMYTFLIHLKKIICTSWLDFRHLFDSKIEFEKAMDLLNDIRKEEAHNRTITATHIADLQTVYEELMQGIGQVYQEIFPTYLVENWRIKIKEVMNTPFNSTYRDETDLEKKLINSIAAIQYTINYVKDIEQKLASIVAPVQKKRLHEELIEKFSTYRKLHEQLLIKENFIKDGALEVINRSIREHKIQMDTFAEKFLLSEA